MKKAAFNNCKRENAKRDKAKAKRKRQELIPETQELIAREMRERHQICWIQLVSVDLSCTNFQGGRLLVLKNRSSVLIIIVTPPDVPFEIKTSLGKGFGSFAAKAINKGTEILRADAIVTGWQPASTSASKQYSTAILTIVTPS